MKRKLQVIFAIAMTMILTGAINAPAFDLTTAGSVYSASDDFHTLRTRMEGDQYAAGILEQLNTGAYSASPAAKTSGRFGLRKAHKYLGYGTLVLAGMSAVSMLISVLVLRW
jgi:hypothetical protein